MTTPQIANRLVELLRQGEFETIYDELFHPEKVKNIDPQSPHFPEVIGVQAIKEKDEMMMQNIAAIKGMQVGEAITSKDHIALPYQISLDLKDGSSMELDEIIVYQVEEGKIILERFFY
ncbi:MAG: nuclear transport factor 2 family protein [Bacteroidota bacterium]